jgi:hypothetical protein
MFGKLAYDMYVVQVYVCVCPCAYMYISMYVIQKIITQKKLISMPF